MNGIDLDIEWNAPIGESVAEMRNDIMNDKDYEYNYVVYEPTSTENGIVLGVFVDVEQAAIFIKGYYGAYENETSLAVKKVPVTDDKHIQSYIQRRNKGTDDDMIPKLNNPTFVRLE